MEGADNPEIKMVRKKRFKWSEQQTLQFINLRMKHDALFTGHRKASACGFDVVIKEMRLDDSVTNAQAAKKWENLKKKYRDLVLQMTGPVTEDEEVTHANWPFFEAMDKALGQKNSEGLICLNVIKTDVDSDVEREPDDVASPSVPGPSTTLCDRSTRLKSRKRKNEVIEYLKEYTERQEKRQRELDEREEERENKKQAQIDKLICILEKLVEKQ